jgi:hypothetical protein
MAKSKLNPTPWVVFAVILALAGGGAALFLRQQASPAALQAASAERTPPPLPTGHLRQLRLDLSRARYLASDESRTVPGGVQATVLIVAKTPTGLDGGAAMRTERKTIDCARGRVFDGATADYDADGKLKSSKVLAAGSMGRPVTSEELEVNLVCAEKPAPGARASLAGFRAAQRDVMTLPDGYADRVALQSKDPDAWAWLCAAAARGAWRKQSPADCDRAVKFNPTLATVRVDRGYLDVLIGKRPQADADFKAVMAADPGDPAALYGHSLVLALAGDKAGSKRFRDQALGLDPKVAEMVVAAYRLNISTEYMTR